MTVSLSAPVLAGAARVGLGAYPAIGSGDHPVGRSAAVRLRQLGVVGRSGLAVAQDPPGVVDRDHPGAVTAEVGVMLPGERPVGRANHVELGTAMNLEHLVEVGHTRTVPAPAASEATRLGHRPQTIVPPASTSTAR